MPRHSRRGSTRRRRALDSVARSLVGRARVDVVEGHTNGRRDRAPSGAGGRGPPVGRAGRARSRRAAADRARRRRRRRIPLDLSSAPRAATDHVFPRNDTGTTYAAGDGAPIAIAAATASDLVLLLYGRVTRRGRGRRGRPGRARRLPRADPVATWRHGRRAHLPEALQGPFRVAFRRRADEGMDASVVLRDGRVPDRQRHGALRRVSCRRRPGVDDRGEPESGEPSERGLRFGVVCHGHRLLCGRRAGLPTLAERWNGTTWSVMVSPNVPGASTNELTGVSCVSSASCFAVGSAVVASVSQTLVEAWNGTNWQIVTSPNPSGSTGSSLSSVSCTSTASCFAVGSSSNSTTTIALTEQWDGTSWQIFAGPNPDSAAVLAGVSCTSPTSCLAVGKFVVVSGTDAGVHDHAVLRGGTAPSWSMVPDDAPPLDALDDPAQLRVQRRVVHECLQLLRRRQLQHLDVGRRRLVDPGRALERIEVRLRRHAPNATDAAHNEFAHGVVPGARPVAQRWARSLAPVRLRTRPCRNAGTARVGRSSRLRTRPRPTRRLPGSPVPARPAAWPSAPRFRPGRQDHLRDFRTAPPGRCHQSRRSGRHACRAGEHSVYHLGELLCGRRRRRNRPDRAFQRLGLVGCRESEAGRGRTPRSCVRPPRVASRSGTTHPRGRPRRWSSTGTAKRGRCRLAPIKRETA